MQRDLVVRARRVGVRAWRVVPAGWVGVRAWPVGVRCRGGDRTRRVAGVVRARRLDRYRRGHRMRCVVGGRSGIGRSGDGARLAGHDRVDRRGRRRRLRRSDPGRLRRGPGGRGGAHFRRGPKLEGAVHGPATRRGLRVGKGRERLGGRGTRTAINPGGRRDRARPGHRTRVSRGPHLAMGLIRALVRPMPSPRLRGRRAVDPGGR